MSKRKPQASADFGPPDWLPLNDAFARVRDGLGSRDLALHALFQALLGGRLKSAVVRLLLQSKQPIGASVTREERRILKPGFWRQFEKLSHTGQNVRAWPKTRIVMTGDWYFFVRRTDLDALYPVTATAKGGEMKLLRRRPGPVTTHDWHAIDGEIARRCFDPATEKLVVPKNESRLARDMLGWCSITFKREPAESEMREAVKRICRALRPT